jgi:hypothetical protein
MLIRFLVEYFKEILIFEILRDSVFLLAWRGNDIPNHL